MKLYLLSYIMLCLSAIATLPCSAQSWTQDPVWKNKLDSLLQKQSFNGVIIVAKGEQILYEKAKGYADATTGQLLEVPDRFAIGSISKQITAVLLMQLVEKGLINLEDPIKMYLTELPQPWAENVTVHHLLTHTHGIQALDQALSFEPGTKFEYSQLGYELLSGITERVTHQRFSTQANTLFKTHQLNHTSHPERELMTKLVKSYTREENKLIAQGFGDNLFVAAGGFISNAQDIVRWNWLLHQGKLVSTATLEKMSQPHATREHPILGTLRYGYGLMFLEAEAARQIGAFGYVSGFVSASFYYPEKEINLVILENIVRKEDDIKETFSIESEAMKIIKSI